ncbi:XRE family transcriptional regulator [Dyella dinghuensis]|uniref:XRE family transcriptional regulator n=1 Tax=Dyella dinghuensis TaxID=1920169 RepID=A0A3S0S4L8_9GAMM|nr:helix-turn-helix transcriptional regulator [Dyella dinghuensis]RUL65810.1 XRE family transcriptional regulator [Dyella dinghuensis]
MSTTTDNSLGTYLKDRRTKLDPAAFGLVGTRRRTPGLRREEVAQRANVSATWYTWLEQGRGGAPSADVVDRIAHALMLTDVEREHVFLLALGRPPKVRYQAPEGVTPRLQRILDALELSPAIIKTSTWDIVAWNRAATVVLADYAALPVEQRNVLRLLFGNPHIRERQLHWESIARFVVAAFRADAARAGASKEVEALIDEMSRNSPEFAKMWSDHDVCHYGEGIKQLRHPEVGMIAMEFSSFVVDGRSDLSMVVHNPVTPEDADKVRQLIESQVPASYEKVD